MVILLTYRQPDGDESVLEAVISPDNSKVYIPPEWKGYSLYELAKGEQFVRLEVKNRWHSKG